MSNELHIHKIRWCNYSQTAVELNPQESDRKRCRDIITYPCPDFIQTLLVKQLFGISWFSHMITHYKIKWKRLRPLTSVSNGKKVRSISHSVTQRSPCIHMIHPLYITRIRLFIWNDKSSKFAMLQIRKRKHHISKWPLSIVDILLFIDPCGTICTTNKNETH